MGGVKREWREGRRCTLTICFLDKKKEKSNNKSHSPRASRKPKEMCILIICLRENSSLSRKMCVLPPTPTPHTLTISHTPHLTSPSYTLTINTCQPFCFTHPLSSVAPSPHSLPSSLLPSSLPPVLTLPSSPSPLSSSLSLPSLFTPSHPHSLLSLLSPLLTLSPPHSHSLPSSLTPILTPSQLFHCSHLPPHTPTPPTHPNLNDHSAASHPMRQVPRPLYP